jgi:hypothetical protein
MYEIELKANEGPKLCNLSHLTQVLTLMKVPVSNHSINNISSHSSHSSYGMSFMLFMYEIMWKEAYVRTIKPNSSLA